MFSQLVESDLHRGELKRKGTFFLITMAAYAVVLVLLGVGGVYAYQAQIDDQTLELVALVPPDTEEVKPRDVPPQRRQTSAPSVLPSSAGVRVVGGPKTTAPSNTSADPTKIAGTAQGSTTQLPPENIGGGNRDYALASGPPNPGGNRNSASSAASDSNGGGGIGEPPPAATVKKKEPTEKRVATLGVVNSRAQALPQPLYPPLAKTAGIEGVVNVEIMIDEVGRVMTARATSGHPLLRQEAERAALKARFSPTLLSEQPVKAKGVITYNFVLRK